MMCLDNKFYKLPAESLDDVDKGIKILRFVDVVVAGWRQRVAGWRQRAQLRHREQLRQRGKNRPTWSKQHPLGDIKH